MKIPAAFAALLLGSTLVHAQEPVPVDGVKLLDKAIAAPGSYAQVCDVVMAPQDVPYRAFLIQDFNGAWFSKATEAAVKANRAEVVKAIRSRLLEIDFSRKAQEPPKDPNPEMSADGDDLGYDPGSLNPLLLQLILDLDAIETLPELLAVEDKLVDGINKAKDDAKASPPVVAGWSVALEGGYGEDLRESVLQRKISLFNSRVAQRDLVIAMAKLMRGKSYAPYLTSKIEKDYQKSAKAAAKKGDLAKFKPGEPLPPELEGMPIIVDPILHVPVNTGVGVPIPYSRESRDEIRAAAQKWVSEH
ncbi:hypothetical protein KBB96_08050 [Luteolibacter ambystomatis]|uniref:Uncharacterized protein n=1 Tax=Luteolibacter ambystomatis TaxID=2824561 RepID=A0A975J2H7_9BACT|nr:hypothetical protein [Luteolibacter ambystomatis]QUE52835.1 hypothetical protein KBB96_08050 [Luteolibacter ambystomatis]